MSNQRPSALPTALPLFDGFPYLLTRLSPAFYHVMLLPRDLASDALRSFANQQAQANQLPTCLLMDASLCLYVTDGGAQHVTGEVPRGGRLITGKLQPGEPVPHSADLTERRARLQTFLSAQRAGRYITGDLSKGGRRTSPQDVARLAGQQDGGIPRGLAQCSTCGEWRGECLDPNPRWTGLVMRVRCQCENDSRCARCRASFSDRKVDANYYEASNNSIMHVPGFVSLSHVCVAVTPPLTTAQHEPLAPRKNGAIAVDL